MTARARLLALFDAARHVQGDVAVFERDEPEAPATLVVWASAQGLTAGKRDNVLFVPTSRFREITVYLTREGL